MPLIFEPGTRYSYALGYDVLAAVVEVVSGMTFSQYLKKYIFDPLAITEMYFRVPENEKYRISAQYLNDRTPGRSPHTAGISSACPMHTKAAARSDRHGGCIQYGSGRIGKRWCGIDRCWNTQA